MEKKYVLTGETVKVDGHILHRIQAARNFGFVQEGELGGFVEQEGNLSHEGNCWIYAQAQVYGCASVKENANVCSHAMVYDNATVCGNATVYGNVRIFGNAKICHDSTIFDDVQVFGKAVVCDKATVFDNAQIYDSAILTDAVYACGSARICGKAKLYGEVAVYGNAVVEGDIKIFCAVICGDAVVRNDQDYIVFKNWWSSGRPFTWTRSNDMWKVGCFYGTGKQLVEKAYLDSQFKGEEYERVVNYVEGVKKRISKYSNGQD